MSGIYEITVSFEMKDGRIFSIFWTEQRFEATFHDPAEVDEDDYIYQINGKEVRWQQLPRGLDDLADLMYEDPHNPKFKYDENYVGRRPLPPA